MGTSIRDYSTPLIILFGIVLGFTLPSVGLMWKPYLTYLLMLLMFSVSLTIEPKEITKSIKNYPFIALGLLMVFIITPLLSLMAKVLFSPTAYGGTVLAFACPSAIATGFWCNVLCGDVATALVLSAVANLLAIVTLPLTMLIALGTVVEVDVGWMIVNLLELILVPLAASFLLKAIVRRNLKRLGEYTSRVNLIIMVMLIWGSIASGAKIAKGEAVEFAFLNIFMLIMLGLAFSVAYGLGRKYGRERAITLGVAASVKNAVLSLVLGMTVFGTDFLPPLIANLIAQNILLIPLIIILRKHRSNSF
jgi:BASS family bile acid:Na+ symporter